MLLIFLVSATKLAGFVIKSAHIESKTDTIGKNWFKRDLKLYCNKPPWLRKKLISDHCHDTDVRPTI